MFSPFCFSCSEIYFLNWKIFTCYQQLVYVFSNLSLKDSKAAAVVPSCTSFQNDLGLTLWTWIATVFFLNTSAKPHSCCHHLNFFQEPWRINGLCAAEISCGCTEEINVKSNSATNRSFQNLS